LRYPTVANPHISPENQMTEKEEDRLSQRRRNWILSTKHCKTQI